MSPSLTPREYEVARLFALGWTYDEIADRLGIARYTVANYRYKAIVKSGGERMVDVWRAQGWLVVPLRASDGVVDVVPVDGPTPSLLRRAG